MANEQSGQNPEVWILDRGGTTQGEREMQLRTAAIRVWPRVEAFAKKELIGSPLSGDTSIVWEVWEQTLHALSKNLKRRFVLRPVRDLDSYIFVAFAHSLKKLLQKERSIEFVPSNHELEEMKQTQDWSWVADLENALELKALVDPLDDRMKAVLHRWALNGDSWEEISKDMGVTPISVYLTIAFERRFGYASGP